MNEPKAEETSQSVLEHAEVICNCCKEKLGIRIGVKISGIVLCNKCEERLCGHCNLPVAFGEIYMRISTHEIAHYDCSKGDKAAGQKTEEPETRDVLQEKCYRCGQLLLKGELCSENQLNGKLSHIRCVHVTLEGVVEEGMGLGD